MEWRTNPDSWQCLNAHAESCGAAACMPIHAINACNKTSGMNRRIAPSAAARGLVPVCRPSHLLFFLTGFLRSKAGIVHLTKRIFDQSPCAVNVIRAKGQGHAQGYLQGVSMNSKQKKLYRKAVAKHEKIFPCKSKKNFQECFTISGDKLLFWYNTEDNSTHVQTEDE
jgi:hypothetical protein